MIYFMGVELPNGNELIVNACSSCGKKADIYYHPELRCGIEKYTVVCEECCKVIEQKDRMAKYPEILKVKRIFFRKVGDEQRVFVEIEDGRVGEIFKKGDEHFTDFCQLERKTFMDAKLRHLDYYFSVNPAINSGGLEQLGRVFLGLQPLITEVKNTK